MENKENGKKHFWVPMPVPMIDGHGMAEGHGMSLLYWTKVKLSYENLGTPMLVPMPWDAMGGHPSMLYLA